MTDSDRRFRRAIVRWMKRNTIAIAVGQIALYLILIPLSIWLFPNETLVTNLLVLVLGLMSSITALGSLLVDLDDD